MSKAIGPLLFFIIMVGLLLLLGRILSGVGRKKGEPILILISRVMSGIGILLGLVLLFVIYQFWTNPDALFF